MCGTNAVAMHIKISAVFENIVALKELFHHILEHRDEYDEDTVHCADGCNARLDDLKFCFLLHTFNGIFEHSDVLFCNTTKHWMYNYVWQG